MAAIHAFGSEKRTSTNRFQRVDKTKMSPGVPESSSRIRGLHRAGLLTPGCGTGVCEPPRMTAAVISF